MQALQTEKPATIEEFDRRVEQFAQTANEEFSRRYASGERHFVLELLLDRTEVMRHSPRRLYDFQMMFYRRVSELNIVPFTETYADYLYEGNPLLDLETYEDYNMMIMCYRIIVE